MVCKQVKLRVDVSSVSDLLFPFFRLVGCNFSDIECWIRFCIPVLVMILKWGIRNYFCVQFSTNKIVLVFIIVISIIFYVLCFYDFFFQIDIMCIQEHTSVLNGAFYPNIWKVQGKLKFHTQKHGIHSSLNHGKFHSNIGPGKE